MTTAPLRRGRILDTATVASLLIIFTALRLGLQLARGSKLLEDKINTIRIVLIGLAWPFLGLGAVPLFFYWRKDRLIDKLYFSTATSSQLLIVFIGTLSVVLGCIFVLSAHIVSLVPQFKHIDGIHWDIAIDTIVTLIIFFITVVVSIYAWNVHKVRTAIRNTPYNTNDYDVAPEQNASTFS